MTSKTTTLLARTALALGLAGCAANPENPSAGSCSLSCSKPYVGAAEFIIQPLAADGDEAIERTCTADFKDSSGKAITSAPMNGPVQVSFLIYEKPSAFGGGPISGTDSTSDSGDTASSTGGFTPGDPLYDKRPVRGVGFTPVVQGDMAVAKSAAEFHPNGDPNTVSSFKFAGIVTPSAEWCSDSCGVMTYEMWPNCEYASTNPVTANVAVGGTIPGKSFKYSFTNSTATQ